MNNVTLIARLGRDPELRYLPSNKAVCAFSVADTNKWKDASGELHEETSWFDCEAWGRTGEVIAEHFRKGQRIGLTGSLRQESWNDKDGNKRSRVKVVVSSFDFIESKSDRDAAPGSPRRDDDRQPARSAGTRQGADTGRQHEPVEEDDIPFDYAPR